MLRTLIAAEAALRRAVAVLPVATRTLIVAIPPVGRARGVRIVELRTVVLREMGVVGGTPCGLLVIRLLRIGSITLQTRATLDTLRRSLHHAHAFVATESREHLGRVVFLIFHRLIYTSCFPGCGGSRSARRTACGTIRRRIPAPGFRGAKVIHFSGLQHIACPISR